MAFGVPDLADHPAPYATAMERGLVRARCLHVVDGDTYDFLLDLGWYQYTYGRVRLRGADAPEMHTDTLEACERSVRPPRDRSGVFESLPNVRTPTGRAAAAPPPFRRSSLRNRPESRRRSAARLVIIAHA